MDHPWTLIRDSWHRRHRPKPEPWKITINGVEITSESINQTLKDYLQCKQERKPNEMTTIKEVHTISRMVRLYNSTNGNPRWRVYFTDGGWAVTKSDIMVSYIIDGPEFQNVPVEFEFSRRGQIVSATPLSQRDD